MPVVQSYFCTHHRGSEEDIDEAIGTLKAAMRDRRCDYSVSVARTLLVLAGPGKAVAKLKRECLFRASTFGFRSEAIVAIAGDWIRNGTAFGLSTGTIRYVSSVSALVSAAPAVVMLSRELLRQLDEGRSTIIKNLLAELDAAFTFQESNPFLFEDEQVQEVSVEELAEGFSYLLSLFHRDYGLNADHFDWWVDGTRSEMYRKLLTDAFKVCRYREMEVLIDGFGYAASLVDGGVRIFSPDLELERSIRLGYIQSSLQAVADRVRHQEERDSGQVASLVALAESFFGRFGNTLATFRPDPIPRYRLEFPLIPPMVSFFMQDAAFIEEWSSMASLAYEDYITPDEVKDVVIKGSITVRDVLKVQRLLGFMHLGLERAISEHRPEDEQPTLHRQSCVPVFRGETFLKFLALAVGDSKAHEMKDLLCADLDSPSLDILYAPVISAGDYVAISLAVFSKNSLVRNLLAKLKLRIGPIGKGDRMQLALANSLRVAGFAVEEEIELTSRTNPLEVDLLAFRDGVLVIFECKNAYAPCNVYEMRNSFEAITKAADQLERRKRWLMDSANQRSLFSTLGWTMPEVLEVRTCIALGNRVFNGYNCAGHPVRQVHELQNVLEHGRIRMDGQDLRMWTGPSFEVGELLRYLDGSTIHADLASAMEPVDIVTDLASTKLIQSSWILDIVKTKNTMINRYSPYTDE